MLLIHTSDSPQDFAAEVLLLVLPFLSAASAAFVLYLRLRSRRLTGLLNPLWPIRFLLSLFTALWSLAELLRLPSVRSALPLTARSRPGLLCRAHLFASQAFLEPASLVLLLYLLQASTRRRPKSESALSSCVSFFQALATSLFASISFLLLHLFLDKVGGRVVSTLGFGPEVAAEAGFGYGFQDTADPSTSVSDHCSNPIYATTLLCALATLYVPLFISASWEAASVAINKRLVGRLYTLCVVVVVAFPIQAIVMAVSTLWNPSETEFKWLSLADAAAIFSLVGVSEWILVFQPTLDAFFAGRTSDTIEECRRTSTERGEDRGEGGLEVVVVSQS